MTRRQSNNQGGDGVASIPPQKIPTNILLVDYLPKGQTINAEYYSSLLVQLKDILKEKRHTHQGGLVLARQCQGSLGTCNPEETGLPGIPVS